MNTITCQNAREILSKAAISAARTKRRFPLQQSKDTQLAFGHMNNCTHCKEGYAVALSNAERMTKHAKLW